MSQLSRAVSVPTCAAFLQCAQLLVQGGCRPPKLDSPASVSTSVSTSVFAFVSASLDLEGRNRRVWAVCTGKEATPGWSPAMHPFFPPRFRAAVQTLLLAAHRQRRRWPAVAEALGVWELWEPIMVCASQHVHELW